MVEEIVAQCASIGSKFHEEIADHLYRVFGGSQVIKALHHGVWIETQRGFV